MIGDPLEIRPGLSIPASELEWDFSRSGGPGGQAVNTTDSRARMRFYLSRCTVLSPGARRRLAEQRPGWVTNDGDIVLSSDVHRSRWQNVEDCRRRLIDAILEALVPPRPRVATRPTRASQAKRVDSKKSRGNVKAARGRVRNDD